MKILSIIPARGGSKGIPRKNIVPLAGKPLLAWTIEASLKSQFIDKTIVSSEDKEILEIAEKFGAEPIKRPKFLATDKALPEPMVYQVLEYLKKKQNYIPDILIYLQSTSPLRDNNDIDEALKLFVNSKATALIAVSKIDKKYLKTFILDKKGFLKGAINNYYPFMNRQSLPEIFLPNGAIYLIKRKTFLKTRQLFSDKTIPFIMPLERSLDIDNRKDLREAENYLLSKGNNQRKS